MFNIDKNALICANILKTAKEIIDKTTDLDNYKKWNNAITEFNDKFINMPFELEVNNISDIILKNSACSLNYKFKDKYDVNENVDKNLLKDSYIYCTNNEKIERID